MTDTKKPEVKKADSVSLQRRKEEITRRNAKIMTPSRMERLKAVKTVK
jgi:hypothetical protein